MISGKEKLLKCTLYFNLYGIPLSLGPRTPEEACFSPVPAEEDEAGQGDERHTPSPEATPPRARKGPTTPPEPYVGK